MFSDKFKISKILGCSILTLLLCSTAYIQGVQEELTMAEITKTPGLYQDHLLQKQIARIEQVTGNSFYFRENNVRYQAVYKGDSKVNFPENAYISMEGTVHNGKLLFEKYHIHSYRLFKIIISIVTLFGVCVYLTHATYSYRKKINRDPVQ